MRKALSEFFLIISLVLAQLLFVSKCTADSYLTIGAGIFQSAKDSVSESRFLNLGYKEALIFGLSHQVEIGAWSDIASQGRTGSFYGAYQLGVEVDNAPIISRAMFGPTVISSPDAYLGGRFPQFTEDLYFGMKDKRGNSIGVKYKHISSAGIFAPNIGRDFFTFEVGVPW